MNGPDGKDNCSKFVDILGLRTIFPLFMKTPTKNRKKIVTVEEHEGIDCTFISYVTKKFVSMKVSKFYSSFQNTWFQS